MPAHSDDNTRPKYDDHEASVEHLLENGVTWFRLFHATDWLSKRFGWDKIVEAKVWHNTQEEKKRIEEG
jgi:hypothetical protein